MIPSRNIIINNSPLLQQEIFIVKLSSYFKIRSHRFIKFDMVPGAITMYFGLLLGLKFSFRTGIGPDYEPFSYICNRAIHINLYIF